jgi:hypothetical protein
MHGYQVVSLSEPDSTFVPNHKSAKPPMNPTTRAFAVATGIAGLIVGTGALLGLFAGLVGLAHGQSGWFEVFTCTLVMAGFFAAPVIPVYFIAIGVIACVEMVHGWIRRIDWQAGDSD